MSRTLAFSHSFVRRIVYTFSFIQYLFLNGTINCVQQTHYGQQSPSTMTSSHQLRRTVHSKNGTTSDVVTTASEPDTTDSSLSQWPKMNYTEDDLMDLCERKTCFMRCCPAYHRRLKSIGGCVPMENDLFGQNVEYLEFYERTLPSSRSPSTSSINYANSLETNSTGVPYTVCCTTCLLHLVSLPDEKFYVSTEGGWLLIQRSCDEWYEYNINEYCLEYFADVDRILPVICDQPDQVIRPNKVVLTVYPIAMAVSIPALLFTFLTYAFVEQLRNLHGKSLMCHVAVLSVGYSFLLLIQTYQFSDKWPKFCVFSGAVVQFSVLASFFWLNVMCFDLWRAFRVTQPVRSSVKHSDEKKFIMYSAYAWGCPAIVTSITLLAEFWSYMPAVFVKPCFTRHVCWFNKEKPALFFYFYGPIAVVLLSNALMFVHTTFNIVRRKRETRIINKTGSKRHYRDAENQRFVLYLKLLVVMGVSWTTEIISWLLKGPDYLWYATDIGNALQGVFIFAIFVCKRRVLYLLKQKFRHTRLPSDRSTSVTTCSGSTKFTRMSNRSVNTTTNSISSIPMSNMSTVKSVN